MEELMAELIRSKVDVEKYTEPGTGLTLLLVGILGGCRAVVFCLRMVTAFCLPIQCACLCGQKMLVEFLLSRGTYM